MAANFTVGMEGAEKAAARTAFPRTDYLSIEDGKFVIIRFLTEHNGLLTVHQHNNVPTRTAPSDYPKDRKWPQAMTGVCRESININGDRVFPDFPDCAICVKYRETGEKRLKPQPRSWALAIIREEIMREGKGVGLRDVMREVEIEGKKISQPKIDVLNFAHGNFWSGLSTITSMHGTWLSRDIRIGRKGTELDTTYSFAAYEAMGINGMAVSVEPTTTDNPVFDLREPEQMAKYMEFAPNLGELVTERASDDYFARFFDERVPQPKFDGGNDRSDEGGTVKPQDEPDDEQLAALAARVQGHPVESSESAEITLG